MNRKSKWVIALLTAALLCGCSASDDLGSDSSSQTQTAAPAVTLPSDSHESEADSSSQTNESEADAAEITPAMWLVTSPDGDTMYMMGSMHALKEECYPLPDYVTDAYESADILAVECDIADSSKSVSAALKYTDKLTYPSGETIADHISSKAYDGISSYLAYMGDDISNYEIYQTWYLSSLLESIALSDSGLDSSLGFDMQLLTMAHKDDKEIYEVESMELQYEMLIGFSDEIYDLTFLSYSEESADEIKQEYIDLYEAWKSGDTDAVEELNTADLSEMSDEQVEIYEEYNQKLLYDRNEAMALTAQELFSEDEQVLFVVGEAHFLGDGGILDLLEEDGYEVERVQAY